MANNKENLYSTSVTVQFVSELVGQGVLVAELDDEKNDSSEFYYGDVAYFRVYRWPSNMELTYTVTDGTLGNAENGVSEEEEYLNFVQEREVSVSKPIKDGTLETTWLGNDLGGVEKFASNKLRIASKGLGVLRAKYRSNYLGKTITCPQRIDPQTGYPYPEYPVIVYIKGVVPEN